MNIKKLAVTHIILGLVSGLAFAAGAVTGIFKLAEIGVGPDLPWGLILGLFGIGILAAVATVLNMFWGLDDV